MRKEYNNRWDAPLVNPGITHGEYEAKKAVERVSQAVTDSKIVEGFESMLAAKDAEQAAHWEAIRNRSERA